jgi:hypothetical protein
MVVLTRNSTRAGNDVTVGYEAELWRMADALRGSMDAAEYKHVVLGLIFLKYISDAFEEQHTRLEAEKSKGADPEDPDEYRALSIFWVPPEARWAHLKAQARQPTIGQLVDDAMAGIERDNPALKGVLPKDYARPALDKMRLGQLIDLISNIKVGDEASRTKYDPNTAGGGFSKSSSLFAEAVSSLQSSSGLTRESHADVRPGASAIGRCVSRWRRAFTVWWRCSCGRESIRMRKTGRSHTPFRVDGSI